MNDIKLIQRLEVRNKKVIVRVDFNVPIKDGIVQDRTRIIKSLPTIEYLMKNEAKVIIISHFGRPKGKKVESMSLRPIACELEKILNSKVIFLEETIGHKAKEKIAKLDKGQVLLLENVRFYPEEEKNDPAFAKELASLCDIYVNDTFSCSHRAHASTVGITEFVTSAAGLLLQDELNNLERILNIPKKPIMAITGGSKVSTKLGLLNALIEKVDFIAVAGAMANTFLKALGYKIGKSLYEEGLIEEALNIINKAKDKNCKIVLPSDVVVADKLDQATKISTCNINEVPEDMMILDLGPKTIKEISEILSSCCTLVWNGPLGAFEIKPFDEATNNLAQIVAKFTKENSLISIAGGGDVVSALTNCNMTENFTYISTAGGAFLEWLEGIELAGIKALRR